MLIYIFPNQIVSEQHLAAKSLCVLVLWAMNVDENHSRCVLCCLTSFEEGSVKKFRVILSILKY